MEANVTGLARNHLILSLTKDAVVEPSYFDKLNMRDD